MKNHKTKGGYKPQKSKIRKVYKTVNITKKFEKPTLGQCIKWIFRIVQFIYNLISLSNF